MAAPGDRNLIDVYADGGFTFKGLIGRRANDTTGLGFAVGRVSPAGAAFDRDLAAALGQAIPVADFEAESLRIRNVLFDIALRIDHDRSRARLVT